jgi:hypothetical protein
MRVLEGRADFLDLPLGFLGAEVDRRTHGDAPHAERLVDVSEHDLIVRVRVGEKFIVVDLDHERDLVGVAPCNGAENAEG